MSEIRLTVKQILDQDFKSSLRGYNPDEVDKFLDMIIQDYESFNRRIEELEQENEQYRRNARRVQEQTHKQPPVQPAMQGTNYDILQRLSRLEKEVFGNKLFD